MKTAAILSLAIAAVFAVAGGFHEAKAEASTPVLAAPQGAEVSAQSRQRRPRVLIERQPAAWDYPRPGYYSWPGPGAVRQCVDWYQVEHRPSGTVVTPQMSCRWVRG